jgi:hypothetical protein
VAAVSPLKVHLLAWLSHRLLRWQALAP